MHGHAPECSLARHQHREGCTRRRSPRLRLPQLHEAALRFGDRMHKPVDKPDTTFFFISPDGSFVKAYSGLSAPKEIAEDMTQYIIKYKRNNPSWHGAPPAAAPTSAVCSGPCKVGSLAAVQRFPCGAACASWGLVHPHGVVLAAAAVCPASLLPPWQLADAGLPVAGPKKVAKRHA